MTFGGPLWQEHLFKDIAEYKEAVGPLMTKNCRLCHEAFISQSKLERHIQQEHIFQSVEEYIERLGPLVTKQVGDSIKSPKIVPPKFFRELSFYTFTKCINYLA